MPALDHLQVRFGGHTWGLSRFTRIDWQLRRRAVICSKNLPQLKSLIIQNASVGESSFIDLAMPNVQTISIHGCVFRNFGVFLSFFPNIERIAVFRSESMELAPSPISMPPTNLRIIYLREAVEISGFLDYTKVDLPRYFRGEIEWRLGSIVYQGHEDEEDEKAEKVYIAVQLCASVEAVHRYLRST